MATRSAASWTSALLMACVMVSLTGMAVAQDVKPGKVQARLRSNIVVSSKLVTLGDLFENAGSIASKAVFRSPSIGQSGTIRAQRVIEAAKRAGMTNIDPNTVATVKVRRDSELVEEGDIIDALTDMLRTKGFVSGTDRVDIELATRLVDQHAAPNATRPFYLRSLRFDRTSGRFSASLNIGGRPEVGTIRLSGRASETVLAPVLTRNMRRGDIVTASDVALTSMPKRQTVLAKPAAMASIIGLAARQPLRAGMIANASYFTAPDIVERSDTVTILFRAGKLTLSMRGKALNSGAKGDVISVQNLQTNRIIRGEIISHGLLQADRPMNTIAALGAKLQ